MHHHDDDTAVALPEGFLWGAATSPHQVEGGNVHSDWWFYETMPGGFLAEASGAACDSYHRWRDDMDLLARNGYNAYRFGIEWARIEPQPGVFDDEAIRHYGKMVTGAHERGLSAFVTLHHFSLPAWFAQAGGWGAPNAVDRFVAYVERIVPVLERGVAGIVTINEPNMVAIMSRVISGKASFGGDGSGLLPDPDPAVVDTLIAAHHAATAVLHRALPGVPIGWSVANQCVQSQEVVPDHADRYRESVEDRFIRPASLDDFIGVQSYTRTLFGPDGVPVHPPKDELTSNGWEYYPQAVAGSIAHVHELVPDVPIIVTENGISTRDDDRRTAYTCEALACIGDLVDAGVPVRGYFHWSLLDNYEWGSWKPTFGLVAVDRASGTYTRTAKPSLAWLGQWSNRGVFPTHTH